MASAIAKWANHSDQKDVFAAKPVRGEIGILVVPETQQYDYLLNHKADSGLYADAMWGAYRGFFDNNIQADWVHIEDIDAYDALYYPYPIMFTKAQADQLAKWVEKGGRLICEACPGYFGDRGRVGTTQPNHGLDAVFGVREDEVEFMPDIGDRIHLEMDGLKLQGGGYLQSYTLAGGRERGRFDDGRLAVVENTHGKGATLLIGTNPSVGYFKSSTPDNAKMFAQVLQWADKDQHITPNNPQVQARLHANGDAIYAWLVNTSRKPQSGEVRIASGYGARTGGTVCWGGEGTAIEGMRYTIAPRDVIVVKLEEN